MFMHTIKRVAVFSLLFSCLLAGSTYSVWSQGALAPSGAPAPVMKTLSQIEPRSIISSIPVTISNSGSYYLAANLAGTPGQNGIIVQADSVTIDLNGFALVGGASSGKGVSVPSAVQGLRIRNGSVRGWGGDGIGAGNCINASVENVLVTGNGNSGISIGSNAHVNDCLAVGNGADGILVGSSSLLLNNSSLSNGISGIHATGVGNRIEGNNLIGNTSTGVTVDSTANLVIKNNAAYNGSTDYNIAAGSSYGQLLLIPGANFTNSTPWANFSSSCPPAQTFCSGVCVALATNVNNCGSCGNVCNFANASSTCSSSTCVLASCNAGFANCDGNPANGCEVSTASDVSNCGACGVVCITPNATPGCVGATCTVGACNAGFGNCDGLTVNGCEVNLTTSLSNCGSCGHVCSIPNGSAGCSAGTCTVASCNAGFGDCNANAADGCEINLTVSANNCGTCGHVCNVPNGTPVCIAGSCGVGACNVGFLNCDANAANGCEVNSFTDSNNCGACGNVCNLPHASSSCLAGACKISFCNSGFSDCDANAANGCETSTATSVSNCGGCGLVCSSNNITPTCTGGTCSGTCNAGFADCNANKQADGCEVNITNDSNNCGACGNVCNATTSQCAASTCKLKTGQSCSAGTQCVSGVCTSLHCT